MVDDLEGRERWSRSYCHYGQIEVGHIATFKRNLNSELKQECISVLRSHA